MGSPSAWAFGTTMLESFLQSIFTHATRHILLITIIWIMWTFRSFRQAISVQSGRLFRSKPAGCFGPKRHPLPKALGRRLQRTAAEELILACHSHLKQLLLID